MRIGIPCGLGERRDPVQHPAKDVSHLPIYCPGSWCSVVPCPSVTRTRPEGAGTRCAVNAAKRLHDQADSTILRILFGCTGLPAPSANPSATKSAAIIR